MKFSKQMFAGVLLSLVFSEYGIAGTLYRCGNTYQDIPCQNASNSSIVKKSNTLSVNEKPLNQGQRFEKVDADCKQDGEIAKKIMWAREMGRTLDEQLEATPDSVTRGVIKEVYKHRGSSLEVKDIIEQECMQQKEKDRLAIQLEIEAARLRSKSK